jgi:DNA invertase Pin-like site-specific DNA recombinase/transposase-like protein
LTMPPDSPAKGVIYARVSTEEQKKEGYSIQSQIRRLEEKMKADGVQPVCDPIIDAESGRGFGREGLKKLSKLANQKAIQYLYVFDLDRLGRNVAETPYLMYRLKEESGVITRTINEEFNFAEPFDFVLVVFKTFPGAVESRQLGERTQRGKIEKFRSGKWVGPIPAGYAKNADGELTISQALEPALTDIFRNYEKTGSLKETTRYANEKHSRSIGTFSINQIRTMLTNPIYSGNPRYGTVSISSPKLALIPEELFNKLQSRILSKNRKLKPAKVMKASVLDELGSKHGIQKVLTVLDMLSPYCPNDQSRMVGNGTKLLKKRGLTVPKFLCQKCGFQRVVPSDADLDRFPKQSLSCPKCRAQHFDAVARLDGLTEYFCKCCGASFVLLTSDTSKRVPGERLVLNPVVDVRTKDKVRRHYHRTKNAWTYSQTISKPETKPASLEKFLSVF